MTAPRQCCGSGLAAEVTGPEAQGRIGFGGALVLEQQPGILVAGQKPEKEPIGQAKWTAIARPAELQQRPVLVDSAWLLGARSPVRARGEEVGAPEARVLLLASDCRRDLVIERGVAEGFYLCRIATSLGDDLDQGAVLQRRTRGLEQPGEWQPMAGR